MLHGHLAVTYVRSRWNNLGSAWKLKHMYFDQNCIVQLCIYKEMLLESNRMIH